MSDRSRRMARAGCAAALVALLPMCGTAWATGPAEPVRLRFGIAADILLDVPRRDAQIGFDAWSRELVGEGGELTDPRSIFFDETEAMADAIRRNEIDLALVPTLDFLRLQAQHVPIEAVRVGVAARASLDGELLLVHRESVARGIRGLAGQRLMTQPGAVGLLSRLWLDTVLAKQGSPDSGTYFGQIRHNARPSQVVLPVFFRQAEAAVLKEATFATVGEMNVQVARDVAVLARSPDLVHGIVCFNARIAPEPRRILTNGLQRMTTSAAGRQIMTLFKIRQLLTYETSQVANVVEMVRQREAAAKASGR